MEYMRILFIAPGKAPLDITIKHTLKAMQALVQGDIACIYPWKDPVGLVCNDNAIAENRPLNRLLEDYDIIRGPFFLAGLGREDFCSLSQEMITKYSKKFRIPDFSPSREEAVEIAKQILPQADTEAICPRCGRIMHGRTTTHALSRRLPVMVCDQCGMLEALEDAKILPPFPLTRWSCFHSI